MKKHVVIGPNPTPITGSTGELVHTYRAY